MNVGRLMQPDPVTLTIHDTLDIADDIMRLGRVRHLPVVDGDRLVGILSHRDLLAAAVSTLLELSRGAQQEWLRKIEVVRAMTADVATVAPSTSVATAVSIMLEKKIGCLPVVQDGRLVGLLTETDCLRCLQHVLASSDIKASLPEIGQ